MSQPDAPSPTLSQNRSSGKTENVNFITEALSQDRGWKGMSKMFEKRVSAPEAFDSRLQTVGGAAFLHFRACIENVDWELYNVTIRARQLRGTLAVGMLTPTRNLRKYLIRLLFLIEKNAEELFPLRIVRPTKEWGGYRKEWARRLSRRAGTQDPLVNTSYVDTSEPQLRELPSILENMGEGLTIFLECLERYPNMDTVNLLSDLSIAATDVKYWALCLDNYRDRLHEAALRVFIHEITIEMSKLLTPIANERLPQFTKSGFKTLIDSQKNVAEHMMELATFFTGTAASALQLSYLSTGRSLFDGLNSLWFLALIFSLGSAGIGLFSLTWTHAMNKHVMPNFVLISITRSPLVLLTLSFTSFSAGVVIFAFSSTQNNVLSILVAILSGISCIFFALLSSSSVFKRLHSRNFHTLWPGQGRKIENQKVLIPNRIGKRLKTILPLFSRDQTPSVGVPPMLTKKGMAKRRFEWLVRFVLGAWSVVSRLKSMQPYLLLHVSQGIDGPVNFMHFSPDGKSLVIASAQGDLAVADLKEGSPPLPETTNDDNKGKNEKKSTLNGRVGRVLWSPDGSHILLKVNTGIVLVDPQTMNGTPTDQESKSASDRTISGPQSAKASDLKSTEDTKTSHPQLHDSVKTLAKIPSANTEPILSMAWLPTSKGFLCIKGGIIKEYKITSDTPILRDIKEYRLDSLRLYDLAIINGQGDPEVSVDRVVCMATSTSLYYPETLKPSSMRRAENRLVVYNLKKELIEEALPILRRAESITVSENYEHEEKPVSILVGYHEAPPQLLEVHMRPGAVSPVWMNLRYTYMSPKDVRFTGPASFGGASDQLVLCGTMTGDICLWHRRSAAFLHCIPGPHTGSLHSPKPGSQWALRPRCIAWYKDHNKVLPRPKNSVASQLYKASTTTKKERSETFAYVIENPQHTGMVDIWVEEIPTEPLAVTNNAGGANVALQIQKIKGFPYCPLA